LRPLTRAVARRALAALTVAVALGCSSSSADPRCISDTARERTGWAPAEALFRSDPGWVGGDAAYSIDLGGGRLLWLFGDSFVSPSRSRTRSGPFARNTIAIQQGADPKTASIRFHHRTRAAGEGEAFFPSTRAERWYWPGHGARLGDVLLVFLWRMKSKGEGAFGFENEAPEARLVRNPDDDPMTWRMEAVTVPTNPWKVFLGTGAAIVHEGHLYLLSAIEPGNHDVFAARWPVDQAARGELGDPEWATRVDGGWTRQSQLSARPLRLFDEGHTEFSVHRDAATGRFVQVQTVGFPHGRVVMRTAPALTGPWSSPRTVYTPPENACARVSTYAAKAHPGLRSPDLSGRVAVSYASNHDDIFAMAGNTNLYFPRFVRLDVATGEASP
jgi:hypothetical protein